MKFRILILFSLVIYLLNPIKINAQEILWTKEVSLGIRYANHPSVIIPENNSILLIGGAVERDLSRKNIIKSSIEIDQKLNPWVIINNSELIYPLIWHSLLRNQNNLYVIGGFNEVNSPNSYYSTDLVERTNINIDGLLSSWTTIGNVLPDKLAKGGAVAINNLIYYSGGGSWLGYSGPTVKSKIYMTTLLPDGDLGVWENAGELPHPMLGHQLIYTGTNLYLISGYNADLGQADGKVYLANFGANGVIDGWTEQTDLELPLKTYDYLFTRSGDYLIVAGGRGPNLDASQVYDDIYYSKIKGDGSLDVWQKSPIKLPKALCCAGFASNGTRVYLTGGHDGHDYFSDVWSINLDNIIYGIPSPTAIPTVTPTPEITILNPLVFVPGMGASWNPDAILHDENVPNEGWTINPLAFDTYEGMKLSLLSAGYIQGDTFFMYPYDWRKPVMENAHALRTFILNKVLSDKPEGTKVTIVGHSMGGLVARAAADSVFIDKIDKIITLGSPHAGTALDYKIWEGANLSDLPAWQAVPIYTYLGIISTKYGSPVNAIQNRIPSFQNLLPVWDYLKNCKGDIISTSGLKWQNNLIPYLESILSAVKPKLGTLAGDGHNTLSSIKVAQRTLRDAALNRWIDGKPTAYEYENGDGAILPKSAIIPGIWKSNVINSADHGQIISDSAGQTKLLQYLGISGQTFITYPKDFHQSIIVTVASPVNFWLLTPNGTRYDPTDKLIILADPPSGTYKVKVKSTAEGTATIYFGRINNGDTAWSDTEVKFNAVGSEKSFEFPVDFSRSDLGAKPLEEIAQCFSQIGPGLKNRGYSGQYLQLDNWIRLIRGFKTREYLVDQWIGLVLNGIDELKGKLAKIYPMNSEILLCLNKTKIKIDQFASDLSGN